MRSPWVSALAVLAFYLAGAPFLSGASAGVRSVPSVDLAYGGAPVAVVGLIALWLAWPPAVPVLVPRAAFLPGHPVLNLVAMLALGIFACLAALAGFGKNMSRAPETSCFRPGHRSRDVGRADRHN